MVDLVRFELTTSSMPWKRAPNCATGPLVSPRGRAPPGTPDSITYFAVRIDTSLRPLPTMKRMLRRVPALFLILISLIPLGLSSCIVRRRLIVRAGGSTRQQLIVSSRATILAVIARQYDAIHDFNATVDMVPAIGSAEKSEITEYKDVRAFILFSKPADIRIVGLLPVVRNKAFDMVSTGADFKLFIPSKSLFLVGRNAMDQPATNKIENLRPQHFLDALIVRPIDQNASKVFMENFTDEDNAFYILHEVRDAPDGQLRLLRTIWFNRLNLQLVRQLIFDDSGNILTDARYSQWQAWDNIGFPKHVEVNRPRDGYGVVIDIAKMDINEGVSDDKFVLEQPEGSRLRVVGQPPASPTAPAAPAPPPPRKKR
jgi:hypothetical protein